MDSKQSYCLGGRQISLTKNIPEHEKKNPKTNKNIKVRKRKCDIYGRNKSQSFTK